MGIIPTEFGILANLRKFLLRCPYLLLEIHVLIFRCVTVDLYLQNNTLIGNIPSELGTCTLLGT